ncbi:hypothetical protein DASC09_043170 [Saccharomycopsis crataegensis]|uniref:Uncharacterized protein n=1 Tax=Saccharomycopsis crataegensis TaxID=43959 RepID=A0AAV5QQW9_9ASCO|nr:hypothetical protein DASC09_043170 [Saccharomycopsis crataegensis]
MDQKTGDKKRIGVIQASRSASVTVISAPGDMVFAAGTAMVSAGTAVYKKVLGKKPSLDDKRKTLSGEPQQIPTSTSTSASTSSSLQKSHQSPRNKIIQESFSRHHSRSRSSSTMGKHRRGGIKKSQRNGGIFTITSSSASGLTSSGLKNGGSISVNDKNGTLEKKNPPVIGIHSCKELFSMVFLFADVMLFIVVVMLFLFGFFR